MEVPHDLTEQDDGWAHVPASVEVRDGHPYPTPWVKNRCRTTLVLIHDTRILYAKKP